MDEYVKRETLLNSICNKHCNCDYDGECPNCRLTEMIQDALAADVAPVRHARWRPIHASAATGWNPLIAGSDPIWGYICTNCRNEAIFDCNDEHILSDYCPNCGARMDGAE